MAFLSPGVPFLCFGAAAVLLLARALYMHLASPLRHIPGPFWARFTDLWRLVDHYRCTQIETQRRLHERLGPAVRIGPNMVSLSDPELVKVVYSTRGEYVKGDFYSVNDALQNGQRIENLFGTRDKARHARLLRPFGPLFKLPQLLSLEHHCSRMNVVFCEELEARFVDGNGGGSPPPVCDLAAWLGYCAWDIDGALTFGRALGFLRAGADGRGMTAAGERCMRYFGVVGQMPWLDGWLGKNPWCPLRFATFAAAAEHCVGRLTERCAEKGEATAAAAADGDDFLGRYVALKDQYPGLVTDGEVVGYLMLNVLAGADTTAVVAKAVVYHVLRAPAVLVRLCAELDAAAVSYPPTYAQTCALPYLQAVVREGMRIHPILGGILERVVPPGGLALPDGRFLPPGVKVGMNPWVMHRNSRVYGPDVDAFRPERWLRGDAEAPDAYEARLRRMKGADLTFGAGSRVCTGKDLGWMITLKMVATIFSRYHVSGRLPLEILAAMWRTDENFKLELVPDAKQWTTRYWWFCLVDHIHVKIRRRTDVPVPSTPDCTLLAEPVT